MPLARGFHFKAGTAPPASSLRFEGLSEDRRDESDEDASACPVGTIINGA